MKQVRFTLVDIHPSRPLPLVIPVSREAVFSSIVLMAWVDIEPMTCCVPKASKVGGNYDYDILECKSWIGRCHTSKEELQIVRWKN